MAINFPDSPTLNQTFTSGTTTWQYDGLTWLSDTPKPTKAELDDKWQDTLDIIAAEKQAVADKKASALAKLSAIGLTEDEAKLLFGI